MGGLMSLFGGQSNPPVPTPPPAVPMADEKTLVEKQKRLLASKINSGGRQSTILGGGGVSSTILGSSDTLG